MGGKKLLRQLVLQTCVTAGLMALLLFAASGDWRWAQAWWFLAIFFAGSLVTGAWLSRADPGLLAARLEGPSRKGQPLWDRIFLLLIMAVWCGWLVLMALDAARWRLSHMPLWLNLLGGALAAAGFAATMIVFRANTFAAPTVRVQAERQQRVIDTGPYALVRHPMYAASTLILLGMPLLLGSWLGLAAVPLFVVAIAVRAVFEERTLARDLPGYADYRRRVRWRLVPGLW
ncbi:MAG TPA: isoprenylcysteine carboxylmethyltransferase family protein [Rhizomicrobium sp.]|jgi:protein-S-isoprenylcysteine O-methyltransferase Ste14